jgi:hypothetical protein
MQTMGNAYMNKKTESHILADLKLKQKTLADKILKIEQKQLIKVGKLARQYQLTDWDDESLIKAFEFLREQSEQQFKNKD